MVLTNFNRFGQHGQAGIRPSSVSEGSARKYSLSKFVSGAVVASLLCFNQSASATDYTVPIVANGIPITLNPGDTVTTTGDNLEPVQSSQATGSITAIGTAANQIQFSSQGFNSSGIFTDNHSTATLGFVTINTAGGGSDGARVFNGSTFTGSNLTINTTGTDGSGVYAATNFGAFFFGVTGTNPIITLSNTTINTSGVRGYGLELDHAQGVQVTNVAATTSGDGAAGILAYDLADVTVTGTQIVTHGGLDAIQNPPYPYEGAAGVVAADSKVTMSDSTILTTGPAAYGVLVLNLTSTNAQFIGTNVAITTSGDNSEGVRVQSQGVVQLSNSQIDTTGFNSSGVFADNHSSATIQGVTINTAGGGSDGARVFNGSTFTGSNLTITTTGTDGSGIYAATNFGAFFDGVTGVTPIINLSNSTINTSGVRAFGLELDHANGVQITNVTATTSGNGAAGLLAYDLADVTVTGSHFTTHGGLDTVQDPPYPYEGAAGVISADSSVTMSDSTILTTGEAAHGIFVLNLTSTNATFTGTNVSVETDGDNAAGLAVQNGGAIQLTNSQVATKGVDSFGILAIGATAAATETVTLNNSSVSTTQADAIHVVGPAATITATNGSSITGGNGVLFHVVSGPTAPGTGNLIADGNVTLVGDVIADPGNLANVALRNSTVLTGAIQNGGAIENSNSTWNMTADSTMASLLVSNGRINFAPPTGGVYKTLTSGSLSGNGGVFGMTVNVAALRGDLLNITGSSAGSHQLAIINQGGTPTDITKALRVVHTGDGIATFRLTTRFVEVGPFDYGLFKGNGSAQLPTETDWYLATSATPPPGPPGPPVPPVRISDTTNAIIGTFASSTLTWYDDLGTLVQRLGELRYDREQVTREEPVSAPDGKGIADGKGAPGKTITVNQEVPDNSGVWIRGIGNSIDVDNDVSRSFTQETGGFQAGFDHRFSVAGGDLYLGAFAGYLYTSRDFGDNSDGHTDSFSIGTYATYIRPEGWYADLVGKYTYTWNELNAQSTNFGRATGDYDIPTIGGSLEIGKRFDLPYHLFLEPQGQIAGVWADSADYRTSSGLSVAAGDQGSLRGRLGLRIGTHVKVNEVVAIEPYVVGSVIHEFLTGDVVSVDNFAFVNTLSGTAGQVAVGATAKLNQHARLYAEYDYLNGDHIEEPWAVSVGFRWAW